MSDFNLLGFLNVNVPDSPSYSVNQSPQNYRIVTPSEIFQKQTPTNNKNQPSDTDSITSQESLSLKDDPLCDDCEVKKLAQLRADAENAERERDAELARLNNEKARDSLAKERAAEKEKKDRQTKEINDAFNNAKIEKDRLRELEKEKERADDALIAELQKRAAKGDEKALEELKKRNADHLAKLREQIEDKKAKRAQQAAEDAKPFNTSIGIVDAELKRRIDRAERQKEINKYLADQIKAKSQAEKDAREKEFEEYKKKWAHDKEAQEQLAQAQKAKKDAEEAERKKANQGLIQSRKDRADKDRKDDIQFARDRNSAAEKDLRDERKREDEKRKQQLEDLHNSLVNQVAAKKAALEKEREEDRKYVPRSAPLSKEPTATCCECKNCLPASRFSKYIITPEGKVYRKIDALRPNSPLKRLIYTPHAPYDKSEVSSFQRKY